MKKNCEICKKEFNVKPSTYERRKTCSRECFSKHKSHKIKLNCNICNKEVYKTQSQINKSKSGLVFCSNKCVGKYNGKTRKQNIIKKCLICEKEINTIKAREKTHVTCSTECQNKWQAEYRKGENSPNYRGGGGKKPCLYCKKEFHVDTPVRFEKRKFCSRDCKNNYWIENTLHNSEFKKAHYEGNLEYRKNHGETLPEKMVREYLESLGLIKDKDFFQEKGFFHKYYADFYIPKSKTIIEVYGDFWHGNPYIYGDREGLKPLYESQKDRIEKDIEKKKDFIKYGFNYFEIWESDIYEDVEDSLKNVKM